MEKNIYKNKKEKIKFNTYYIYSDEEIRLLAKLRKLPQPVRKGIFDLVGDL